MNNKLKELINYSNSIYEKYEFVIKGNVSGDNKLKELISQSDVPNFSPEKLRHLHTRLMELSELEESSLGEYEYIEAEYYYNKRHDLQIQSSLLESKREYESIVEAMTRLKTEYNTELSTIPLFKLYYTIVELTTLGFSKEIFEPTSCQSNLIAYYKHKIEDEMGELNLFKAVEHRARLEITQEVLRTLFYMNVIDEKQYDLEAQVIHKLINSFYKDEIDELLKKVEILKEKNIPTDVIQYTLLPYMNETSL